jgi:hypothetical protein
MAYTYQNNVENYLDRPLTDGEAALFTVLEQGVEGIIDVYCGRTFEADKQTETTQTYDGGDPEIFFDTPAQTLTMIQSQDINTGELTLIDPTGYVAYPYNSTPKLSVMRRIGSFPYGIGNIIVTGTFGDFLTPPEDIVLAATIICADIINLPDGLKSETIEGYAREFSSNWNPTVQKVLDNRRRVLL